MTNSLQNLQVSTVIDHHNSALEQVAQAVQCSFNPSDIQNSLNSGQWEYVRSLNGKNRHSQGVIASLSTDKAHRNWLQITYKTFKHGGHSESISLPCFENEEQKLSPKSLQVRQKRLQEQAKKYKLDQKKKAQEKLTHQKEIAKVAQNLFAQTLEVSKTPYTQAKGLPDDGSILYTVAENDPRTLIIPMMDEQGKIWNVQKIFKDGTKRFLKGGRKKGLFYKIGENTSTILCEGWATGISLYDSTSLKFTICFDAGNLKEVAKTCPDPILGIAGDNDYFSKTGQKVTKETSYRGIFPPMLGEPDKDSNKGTDWNDFYQAKGKEAVLRKITAFIRNQKTLHKFSKTALEQKAYKKIVRTITWDKVAEVIFKDDINSLVDEVLSLFPQVNNPSFKHRLRLFAHKILKQSITAWEKCSTIRDFPHIKLQAGELPDITKQGRNENWLINFEHGGGKTQKTLLPFIKRAKQEGDVPATITPRCSVTTEIAIRTDSTDYRNLTDASGHRDENVRAVATTAPSANNPKVKPYTDQARNIATDETTQFIDQLVSPVADQDDFDNAHSLFKNNERTLALDAGWNDYYCKVWNMLIPDGQPLKAFSSPPQKHGFKAKIFTGEQVFKLAQEQIIKELMLGGTPIVPMESPEKAEILGDVLKDINPQWKVIVITQKNKEQEEQQRFLSNPDRYSLLYDCVIHSPTISTGVSIQHEEFWKKHKKGHFTKCFFIGGGFKITHLETLQMMRRCRYIKDWELFIQPNSSAQYVEDIDELGFIQTIEDVTGKELTSRQAMKRQIEHNRENMMANYLFNLVMSLKYYHFDISIQAYEPEKEVKQELKEQKQAQKMSKAEEIASKDTLTKDDHLILTEGTPASMVSKAEEEAIDLYELRCAIKGNDSEESLTADDIIWWDEGRVKQKLEKWEMIKGNQTFDNPDLNSELDKRDYKKALYELYAVLFAGIDINQPFTQDIIQTVYGRMKQPLMQKKLATFGAIDKCFGLSKYGSEGKKLRELKKPLTMLKMVFEKAGQKLTRKTIWTGRKGSETQKIYLLDSSIKEHSNRLATAILEPAKTDGYFKNPSVLAGNNFSEGGADIMSSDERDDLTSYGSMISIKTLNLQECPF